MKLVIDIETQNSFQDVGSRSNFSALKISVAGVYWYPENRYYIFTEDEMDKLENLFSQTEYVIGFNTLGFDLPVLSAYIKNINLPNKRQIDMMLVLQDILGYKISLEQLARATLGAKKISSGLEAIKMWRKGQLDELKRYCLNDVRLTKEIYEYGLKNGFVKFNAGWKSYEVPVNWE